MSALRVALVLGRSSGGIGTHVADLSEGLRAAGHRVRIVTDAGTAATFGFSDALLAWPNPRRPDPRAAARLRATVRAADLVHAHGHQAGAVAALALGRARSIPLVVSLHNMPPELTGPAARIAAAAEAASMRRADLVTGASSDLVARAARLGARHTALALVPSPRVPGLLTAGDAQRKAARARVRAAYALTGLPLVVTISRIAPQKDLPTLVAAQLMVHAGHEWLVAGSGVPDLLDRVRAQAGHGLRFLGAVPDPADLLLAADLFVLTSTWEARALVVQEAMAAGLPVVASDTGGLPDLVTPETGILVPVGDRAGVAAAVDLLLADEQRRRDLGAAGRVAAAAWPGRDEMVQAWVESYHWLLGGIP